MPQDSHDGMKGTSPSKLIQQGVDQSWNQQNKASTNPQDMIKQQFNKNPKPVPGAGK